MPRTSERSSASAVVEDSRASAISVRPRPRVAGDQFLGQAEIHRQGDQLGLRAVVQVALDPAQLGGGVVDRLRPRGLQLADPLLQLGVLRPGQQSGGGRVGPQQQRRTPPAERQEREGDQRGELQGEPDGLHLEQPRQVAPGGPVAQPEPQPDEHPAGRRRRRTAPGSTVPSTRPASRRCSSAKPRSMARHAEQQRQADPDHQQRDRDDQEGEQHETDDPQGEQRQHDADQAPPAGRPGRRQPCCFGHGHHSRPAVGRRE